MPYFFITLVDAPTPHRDAKASSRFTLAGPGTPTRTSAWTPALRSCSSQASTGSASKANWVTTAKSWPRSRMAACLSRLACHNFSLPISGWPSGYADPSDSVFCQEAGADDRQRILVRTHWLQRVARNDESMVGSRFALQAGEEAFQLLLRLQSTCRDVRDRQKAQIARPLRRCDPQFERLAGQECDRNLGSLGDDIGRLLEVRHISGRHLDRIIVQQSAHWLYCSGLSGHRCHFLIKVAANARDVRQQCSAICRATGRLGIRGNEVVYHWISVEV